MSAIHTKLEDLNATINNCLPSKKIFQRNKEIKENSLKPFYAYLKVTFSSKNYVMCISLLFWRKNIQIVCRVNHLIDVCLHASFIILEFQFDLQKRERGKIFLSSFRFHLKRISFLLLLLLSRTFQAVTMKSKTLIVLLWFSKSWLEANNKFKIISFSIKKS